MSIDNQPKTKTEWFTCIDEQSTSGLSQTEFCKQRGLILCRFYYYKKLRRSELNSKPNESFSPVIIRPDKKSPIDDIKIDLPNGFCCHLSSNISAERLKQIIGVLISC